MIEGRGRDRSVGMSCAEGRATRIGTDGGGGGEGTGEEEEAEKTGEIPGGGRTWQSSQKSFSRGVGSWGK